MMSAYKFLYFLESLHFYHHLAFIDSLPYYNHFEFRGFHFNLHCFYPFKIILFINFVFNYILEYFDYSSNQFNHHPNL